MTIRTTAFVGVVALTTMAGIVFWLGASVADAADISVAGKKLVIVDKLVAASKAKAVLVVKDPGATKGAGTDPAQIEARLDVSYDSVSGAFLAPQGGGWTVNKTTVAKYVNKPAPVGGATKVSVIKPGKLLKLVAKSLGDVPIDISSAPTSSVLGIYTVTNGGETNRHCTAFPACAHKVIGGGTGSKLVCKNGTGATCPGGATTTTTTSTTTTTVPGIVLQGALTATPGRFNYNLTLGLPGANSACNTNFPSTHACTYAELQSAEAAGDLDGLKDVAANTVTSFWAIDNGQPPLQQCQDDILGGSMLNWEYGTAHTASRGQKVDLNNALGTLGSLQSSLQCNFSTSWVGCCL